MFKKSHNSGDRTPKQPAKEDAAKVAAPANEAAKEPEEASPPIKDAKNA